MKSIRTIVNLNSLIILTILFLLNNMVNAQEGKNDKKAQLESQKVAFITKKIDLSVTEAQKFWPVYNELQSKKEQLVKEKKDLFQRLNKKNGEIPDLELEKISDEYIKLVNNENKLTQEYHNRFKEVIGIRKTMEYYRAEEQFKMWLLGEMKKKPVNK